MTAAARPPRQDPPKADDRKARLAAALKANIARRKEQAAAREKQGRDTDAPHGHPTAGNEQD